MTDYAITSAELDSRCMIGPNEGWRAAPIRRSHLPSWTRSHHPSLDNLIKGKVVEVDPGDAKLRVAGSIADAVFGGGSGGKAGGGTFRATGEVYRIEGDGKLVRIADFEHQADIDGGAFTSDGDMIRAGADQVATLVANFLEKPRDNNQVN